MLVHTLDFPYFKQKIETYKYMKISNSRNAWHFVSKLFLTCYEKKSSSDPVNLLKFEAEGREFVKFLRLLQQVIQTMNTFCNRMFFFNLLLEVFQI